MKDNTHDEQPTGGPDSRPWYREGYVWLLIVIPAAAFFAGLLTLVIAMHGADVELPHPQ